RYQARKMRKSASFLRSASRCAHPAVCKVRTFFLIGGLYLTANLTVDRPRVKELAGLSDDREENRRMDRQSNYEFPDMDGPGNSIADKVVTIEADIHEHSEARGRAMAVATAALRPAPGRRRRHGRLLWAVGKNAMTAVRGSVPDMLAAAERDLPAGFFSLVALERYMRETFAVVGLQNSFTALERVLLIPAIDLDSAQRVVFGRDDLRDVPISEAVAASSAIPGFFEPYTLRGRDYVDGGVGFSGHADLAAEAGADVVIVVNPLVPNPDGGVVPLRNRGL